MSSAVIKENLGDGLYVVDLVYNLSGYENNEISPSLLNLPTSPTEYQAWCADYSLDIEIGSVVGIIDFAGWLERNQVQPLTIQPGWDDEEEAPNISCEHNIDRDGLLKPQSTLKKTALVMNVLLHAWWQKWIHSYRTGRILEKEGDFCKVELDLEIAPTSPLKWLPLNTDETICPDKEGGTGDAPYINIAINAQSLTFENVEIDYMDCNGAAFDVGDWVVVQFETTKDVNDPPIQIPKVIGFVIEPQPCCIPAIVAKVNNPSDIDYGKKLIYYRDKNDNWKTRDAPTEIDYGFVGWLGNKQTITFKTPINRHYHNGQGLSKEAFVCGRALPLAPYNIIGATLYPIAGKKYPLVVCRISDTIIAFYFLNDDDLWIEFRRFENFLGDGGRAYRFNNIIYFSESGLKAVTLVTDTVRFPLPPFFQDGFLNVPTRFEINLSSLTSVSFTVIDESRTLNIIEVNAYSTIIELECEFAVAYEGEDLRVMTGDFTHRVSNYSPPVGEYAYYTLPTNDGIWVESIEDYWCENGYGRGYPILCETGSGYGQWSHWSNYGCASHEACYHRFETTKNREFGSAGIKGEITSIPNMRIDVHEFDRTYASSGLKTESKYEYTTYETAYNFWVDIWGTLDSINYSGVSAPAVPGEVEGLITRKYVPGRLTADFFGAYITVIGYLEDTVTSSTSRMILVDKYPGGALSAQELGTHPAILNDDGSYSVSINIGPAYNLKSTIDASFKVEKINPRYTIVMADPVTNFLVLAGDNKLLVYREGRPYFEKEIEYETKQSLTFKVNSFDNDNIMGIWNNTIGIEFTANKDGDFMISDGETFGELRGYPLNKWTDVGLV